MRKILFLWLLLHVPQASASWVLDAQFSPRENRFIVKVLRWDEYDSTPNPLKSCGVFGTCQLAFMYSIPMSPMNTFSPMDIPEAAGLKTMGELAQVFARKGNINREFKSQTGRFGKSCLGLAYLVSSGSSMSFIPLPGGSQECFLPQIDPTYCNIADSYIELNHGTIDTNSVNGNVAGKTFRVSCNNNYQVSVVAVDGNGIVALGKGLVSHLKINGVDLGAGYNVRTGPEGNTLVLTSTLSGYSGGTGDFQGYKVIMLTLP